MKNVSDKRTVRPRWTVQDLQHCEALAQRRTPSIERELRGSSIVRANAMGNIREDDEHSIARAFEEYGASPAFAERLAYFQIGLNEHGHFNIGFPIWYPVEIARFTARYWTDGPSGHPDEPRRRWYPNAYDYELFGEYASSNGLYQWRGHPNVVSLKHRGRPVRRQFRLDGTE